MRTGLHPRVGTEGHGRGRFSHPVSSPDAGAVPRGTAGARHGFTRGTGLPFPGVHVAWQAWAGSHVPQKAVKNKNQADVGLHLAETSSCQGAEPPREMFRGSPDQETCNRPSHRASTSAAGAPEGSDAERRPCRAQRRRPSTRGLETGDKDVWALPGRIQAPSASPEHKNSRGGVAGDGGEEPVVVFLPSTATRLATANSPLHAKCCTDPQKNPITAPKAKVIWEAGLCSGWGCSARLALPRAAPAGCRFPDAGDSAKGDILQRTGHVANYPRCVASPRLGKARGQGPNAAEKAGGERSCSPELGKGVPLWGPRGAADAQGQDGGTTAAGRARMGFLGVWSVARAPSPGLIWAKLRKDANVSVWARGKRCSTERPDQPGHCRWHRGIAGGTGTSGVFAPLTQ